MSELFINKYRIPSNRLRGWDYARNGAYFITIVTHNRRHLFGEIKGGEMILNDIGKIVSNEFFKSFEIRNELFMGNFILMPNHLHAIIILDNSNFGTTSDDGNNDLGIVTRRDARPCVSTNQRPCVSTNQRPCVSTNQQPCVSKPDKQFILQRRPKSISSFVAAFKSSSIMQIDDWIDTNNQTMKKFNRDNPLWQANYHDHVIRNPIEYHRISEYIINNPKKWDDDTINRR